RRARDDADAGDDDLPFDAYGDDEDEEEAPLDLKRKAIEPRALATPDPRPAPVIADRNLAPSAAIAKPKQAQLALDHHYTLPGLDLLT
ncbi:hypothetical protein, partial [Clostridium perfringens]